MGASRGWGGLLPARDSWPRVRRGSARKGGASRCFPRSGWKGSWGDLAGGGAAPYAARPPPGTAPSSRRFPGGVAPDVRTGKTDKGPRTRCGPESVQTFCTVSRARQRRASRLDHRAGSGAESAMSSGECVTGRSERQSAMRKSDRPPPTGGRRPAAPFRAEALRARRRAGQLPRARRPVAKAVTQPGTAAALSGRPSSAPDILSPRTDHHQGRARRRVANAMAQAPPLMR